MDYADVEKPKVLINMNPYQGLKPKNLPKRRETNSVLINMNPYQGLKPGDEPKPLS